MLLREAVGVFGLRSWCSDAIELFTAAARRASLESMSQTVSVVLSPQVRQALQSIVDDRRQAVKYVLRARVVLLSDARSPVLQVARQAGVSRPTVWRWQQRFADEGLDDLLRDKTRPPGKPATAQDEVQAVLERTLTGEPPGEATHWTGRAMAAACGLSLRTVQRIWDAHRLQPHRVRTFKRSTDPHFAAKLDHVVGLYMAPPRHTVVLSLDEKSQIQALDRTQPGCTI